MPSSLDRCSDCRRDALCPLHADCREHHDVELAAELGRGWARYRWHARDIRAPWPAFEGNHVEVAMRVAAWLARPSDEARRRKLAERCNDSAGLAWEALHRGVRVRDLPYRAPSRAADVHRLPEHEHVQIWFRSPQPPDARLTTLWAARARSYERAAMYKKCSMCAPSKRCAFHEECVAHRDADLASEIGARWAHFAWQTAARHKMWPRFEGRCAAIATHLVAWLARAGDAARVLLLAEICCWRADMMWEAMRVAHIERDELASAEVRHAFPLPGAEHVHIRFDTPQRGRIVQLTAAALTHDRARAARFRAAQGLERGAGRSKKA